MAKAPRNPHGLFRIEGECHRPHAFSKLDLDDVHSYYRVEDVSKVDERLFTGRGVRLRKLIDLVGPDYGTRFLTVESMDGEISACFPLPEVSRAALIVYTRDGKPMTVQDGGPARFVVPFVQDPAAHVRSLGALRITTEPTGPLVPISLEAPRA